MKTAEELKALRDEVKNLSQRLAELSEDELKQVTGGANVEIWDIHVKLKDKFNEVQ